MTNLTKSLNIVINKGDEISLENGYDLVIIEDGQFKVFREGNLPKKKSFLSLRKSKKIEVYGVSSDDHHELIYKKPIPHPDGIHNFMTKITIRFGVNSPIQIIKKLKRDPVKRLKNESSKVVTSILKNKAWEDIKNGKRFGQLKENSNKNLVVEENKKDKFNFDQISQYAINYGLKFSELTYEVIISEEDLIVEKRKDEFDKEKLISSAEVDKDLHVGKNKHDLQIQKKEFSEEIKDIERKSKLKDQITKTAAKYIDKVGSNLAESSRNLEDVRKALRETINIQKLIDTEALIPSDHTLLGSYNDGNLSYELPTLMETFKEHTVTIRIATNDIPIESLKIKNESRVESVEMALNMSVSVLDDSNSKNVFEINHLSTANQIILKETYSEWIFSVVPQQKGLYPLLIRILALDLQGNFIKEVKRIKKEINIIGSPVNNIEQIKLLIAKNRIEKAIEKLMVSLKHKNDLQNELIILSRQFTDLEHSIRCNLITYNESLILKNRTCYSLLGIIEKLI